MKLVDILKELASLGEMAKPLDPNKDTYAVYRATSDFFDEDYTVIFDTKLRDGKGPVAANLGKRLDQQIEKAAESKDKSQEEVKRSIKLVKVDDPAAQGAPDVVNAWIKANGTSIPKKQKVFKSSERGSTLGKEDMKAIMDAAKGLKAFIRQSDGTLYIKGAKLKDLKYALRQNRDTRDFAAELDLHIPLDQVKTFSGERYYPFQADPIRPEEGDPIEKPAALPTYTLNPSDVKVFTGPEADPKDIGAFSKDKKGGLVSQIAKIEDPKKKIEAIKDNEERLNVAQLEDLKNVEQDGEVIAHLKNIIRKKETPGRKTDLPNRPRQDEPKNKSSFMKNVGASQDLTGTSYGKTKSGKVDRSYDVDKVSGDDKYWRGLNEARMILREAADFFEVKERKPLQTIYIKKSEFDKYKQAYPELANKNQTIVSKDTIKFGSEFMGKDDIGVGKDGTKKSLPKDAEEYYKVLDPKRFEVGNTDQEELTPVADPSTSTGKDFSNVPDASTVDNANYVLGKKKFPTGEPKKRAAPDWQSQKVSNVGEEPPGDQDAMDKIDRYLANADGRKPKHTWSGGYPSNQRDTMTPAEKRDARNARLTNKGIGGDDKLRTTSDKITSKDKDIAIGAYTPAKQGKGNPGDKEMMQHVSKARELAANYKPNKPATMFPAYKDTEKLGK